MTMRNHARPLLLALLLGACTSLPQALGSRTAVRSAILSNSSSGGSFIVGQVLGLDDRPATGIDVQSFLASSSSGGLVSNNAAGYRTQATGAVATTDAEGDFRIADPGNQPLNLEAALQADVQAFRAGTLPASGTVTMQLAYTGSVSGRVVAPSAPGVTSFLGIEVFIPGSSYQAITNAAGDYTLSNVPVGAFDLVADSPSLGQASISNVIVASRANTAVPDLALQVSVPQIDSASPPNGGPGTQVELSGANFGATTGEPISVSVGGATAVDPVRVDDHTIRFQVPTIGTSDGIVVTVGQISSAPASFSVLKGLSFQLSPYLGLGKQASVSVSAVDTGDHTVPDPVLQLGATGSAVALQGGVLTGIADGTSEISASSGTLVATMDVTVSRVVVSTYAGTGQPGAQDGPANSATFASPHGLAFDASGDLFVSDLANYKIREITPGGLVSTFAGNGTPGLVNGPAASAEFNWAHGVAVDASGDVYVGDNQNNCIRKITPQGQVTTLAGSGVAGYVDALGSAAQFNGPTGVAVDSAGNVYVGDRGNNLIRRITPQGQVTTVAGNGTSGDVDGPGASAEFFQPDGVALDATGDLYVGEWSGQRVRKVAPDGTVSTVAGAGYFGYQDGKGSLAVFGSPRNLLVDPNGNLIVSDTDGNRLREIAPDGTVTTLAGTGTAGLVDGIGPMAEFNHPYGLALDAAGRLYVGDSGNNCIRIVTY